jgi:4-amino-4-deoxy-L-arabinose transferase-like glycosyltransferase
MCHGVYSIAGVITAAFINADRRTEEGDTMHVGNRTLITVLLFLLSFAVVLPSAPVFHALPHRDSGVFLYIGQQILEGQVPYRDVWDHKGPLIFYMNALGLALSGGSEWGVWVLQLFLLCTAAYLGYTALDRQLGSKTSLLSTVIWLANLVLVWDGGNRVEGFALVFQFAALYALCRLEHRRLQELVVGCSLALSFLLRPELAALPLAVGVYLVGSRACARHFRDSLDCGLSIAAGGTAVFSLVVLVFWSQNALRSMVDATLLYNLAYVSTPPLAHFAAILGGSKVLSLLSTLGEISLLWSPQEAVLTLKYSLRSVKSCW